MLGFILAAASWEEVVPFIAMVAVPLCTAIGVLWKRNNALQDKALETVEKVIPLSTEISNAVADVVSLAQQVQERTPSKAQIDRFSRNLERLGRLAGER